MRADQRVALTGVLQKQRKDIKYLGKAKVLVLLLDRRVCYDAGSYPQHIHNRV